MVRMGGPWVIWLVHLVQQEYQMREIFHLRRNIDAIECSACVTQFLCFIIFHLYELLKPD